APVGPGDDASRPAHPGAARAPRRADDVAPGGGEPARPSGALDLTTMARTKSDAGAPADATGKQKKPKKPRWYHQVWAAYQMTRKQDPTVTWLILGVFVGILAVVAAVVLLLDLPTGFQILYIVVLGVPFAALGAMFTLTRKAEKAAYTQIEGQPGA